MNKQWVLIVLVSMSQSLVGVSAATHKAQVALNQYASSNPSSADVHALRDYLGYFRSFYQAVTPPPRALVEQLTVPAHDYIERLEEIVDEYKFTIKPKPGMVGASRLGAKGVKFYESAIKLVEKQFSLNQPCCGELAQMVDRTKQIRF